VNNGVITVNSDNSASIATLNLGSQGVTIEGSGEIVLAAPGNLANFTNNTQPLIHGTNHTIRGEGQIAAQIVNNGTIRAEDINGGEDAELLLTSGAKTNHGVIQSSAGSRVRSNVSITQGTTGQLIADGSEFFLGNITISGGKLESRNGGVFRTTGNALSFTSVEELAGQLNLVAGGGLTGNLIVRGGGFSNNGTVVVNQDDTGFAAVHFAETGVLEGTGEIILNGAGSRSNITTAVGDIVGTLGSGQTTRGVGQIEAKLTNNGIVIAEPRSSGAELLFLNSLNPKTNNNVIRADAGATLGIRSTTINQHPTNGRIIANLGIVDLRQSAVVTGGTLEAVGDGKFLISGSTRLEDLVIEAPLELTAPTPVLTLGGTIENNNTIKIANRLRAGGDVSLGGAGEVLLGVVPMTPSFLEVASDFTMTNESGHKISGMSGATTSVTGSGTLINNGMLSGASATELINIATRLAGSGTIRHIRSNSVLAPGAAAGEAGRITLEGNLTVNFPGSQIQMEIGGNTPGLEYDQIFSSDPTSVITFAPNNTHMNVSFVNDFFPSNGHIFTLVETAGTITGNLSAINLPVLPSGFTWQNVSTSSTIAYQLMAPLAADFDQDGDVDADDFELWQAGFPLGSGAIKSDGDADDDGDVDGRDFLWWQQQYTDPALRFAPAVVPEPGCLALLTWAVSTIALRHSRRFRSTSNSSTPASPRSRQTSNCIASTQRCSPVPRSTAAERSSTCSGGCSASPAETARSMQRSKIGDCSTWATPPMTPVQPPWTTAISPCGNPTSASDSHPRWPSASFPNRAHWPSPPWLPPRDQCAFSVVGTGRNQAFESRRAYSFRLSHALRGFAGIKGFRIEGASPLHKLIIEFVVGIGDCRHVVQITPGTPNIFRRTGTLAVQALRVLCFGVDGQITLEGDFVLPAITKVIHIDPFLPMT
jgi:hypothetical protein